MRRLYWDSCVVIYRLQGVEPWNLRVAAALAPIEEARLVVTDLTRLECRIGPLRDNDRDTLSLFDRFFTRPDIEKAPLSKAVFDLATELRAHHRLKTPDAIHLAAAIAARCDEFWTNDDHLNRAAAGRIGIRAFNDATFSDGTTDGGPGP